MTAFDADVVIIGYGPVGVAAANVLGANGIKTIVIERYQDIYGRARAVTVNDVTLRNFQAVGLADALVSDMDETFALRTMTYSGQLLNMTTFPPGEAGYCTSYSIYQPAMEKHLRAGVERYADHVDVRFGLEVSDIAHDADGVSVTARDLESGATTVTRARFALACDGGSSTVREKLGIRLLGDTLETRWVIIDAFVKRWWPDRHILTFWSDRDRPAVDIALSLGTHRWELPLKPHETEADFTTHDQLWVLLEAMGVGRDDVELHQHAFYKHHIRRAEHWQQGRVFLLGDAAHLMPPWAGQGMQSGIRDAFNVGWKLVEVLAGRLPETVLATYEPERGSDVERYTQISVFSGRIVKQELSPQELAMIMPKPGEPLRPSPALAYPTMVAGWLTGDTGPDSAVGKYMIQPQVATTNGRRARLDHAIGNGFTLLGDGVDPVSVLTAEQHNDWARLGATFRKVIAPDAGSTEPSDIIDLHGHLLAWMRRYGASVIAVRPDRFVAAADTSGLSVPVVNELESALP